MPTVQAASTLKSHDTNCVCSLTGGTLIKKFTHFGPDTSKDGTNNWVVYKTREDLLANLKPIVDAHEGTILHKAKVEVDHICCQYSRWGFEVFPGSKSHNPHAVAFYHIKPPVAYRKTYGNKTLKADYPKHNSKETKTFFHVYTWAELLEGFDKAKDGDRNPRVWKREQGEMIEIAINFCPVVATKEENKVTTHSINLSSSRNRIRTSSKSTITTEDKMTTILRNDIQDGQQLIDTLEKQIEDMQITLEEQRQIVGKKKNELQQRRQFLVKESNTSRDNYSGGAAGDIFWT